MFTFNLRSHLLDVDETTVSALGIGSKGRDGAAAATAAARRRTGRRRCSMGTSPRGLTP